MITGPRTAGNDDAPSFARMSTMRDLLGRLGATGAAANAAAAAARRREDELIAEAFAARVEGLSAGGAEDSGAA
jgi:hypothetical protein